MKILTLAENAVGKDYIVGDVHGFFNILEMALDAVDFDVEKDRLICCGDLVDRGSRSHEVADWLQKPWFYSVVGNHDAYYGAKKYSTLKSKLFWFKENREWFYSLPKQYQNIIVNELHELPVIIEVENKSGLIGIVHGGVPEHMDWEQLKKNIKTNNYLKWRSAVWNRRVARKIFSGEIIPDVENVTAVFSGHTVNTESFLPIFHGNRYYIDTGVGYSLFNKSAKLTICELINPTNYKQI